jgi:hypothetical protein
MVPEDKKHKNDNGLVSPVELRLRHDLARVCPTVAENISYISVMLMNDAHEIADARIEPTAVDAGYCGSEVLNRKFNGSAVWFRPERGERASRSDGRFSTRENLRIGGASGAKGEVAFHAAV